MDAEDFQKKALRKFNEEQASRKLHWETRVVLGYCNLPLHIVEDWFDAAPILGQGSLCGTNLERLILGGIKVIVWSPGIPFWMPSGLGLGGRAKVRFIQQQLEAAHGLSKQTGGLLQVARSASEIRKINEAGSIAILLHLSGVNHLNDLGILREYYDLGVRMIHCGFQDHPEESPGNELTEFQDRNYHGGKLDANGVRTIEEMKRIGMIVDVAHVRSEGFDDIVPRLEGLPFVYSHGGCHALVPHWRNMDDARIRLIAEHGGVYGIGVYIDPPPTHDRPSHDEENAKRFQHIAEGRKKRQEAIEASAKGVRDFIRRRYSMDHWQYWEERELARLKAYPPKSTIHSVVAHMKYIRDHFGAEIVGYGPDYEFTFGYVVGLEEADKTPSLTRELLAAGFTAGETQGAMGNNFMRVFEAILK